MRKIWTAIFISIFVTGLTGAQPLPAQEPTPLPAADIVTIRDCYARRESQRCIKRDAIFFVHGIFGDADSFTNGVYQWPQELAEDFPDVDVFVIKYRTQLLSWYKSDVATFDQIAEVLMSKLQGPVVVEHDVESRDLSKGFLAARGYRSVGFIAHSLGGNVAAAYIHSVKSELGHSFRAQNAYLITLGTPADGAQIANVADILKEVLHQRDPLLKSLRNDNLFLRMLAMWRRAEDWKGLRFKCRSLDLYVGIEGAPAYAFIPVVAEASARKPYEHLAKDIKVFDGYNHFRIAAPDKKTDPLNVWVTDIIKKERTRMDKWTQRKLCTAEL